MEKDAQVYSDIMDKIEFEPIIQSNDITLGVYEGFVTLYAHVSTYIQRRAVEQ